MLMLKFLKLTDDVISKESLVLYQICGTDSQALQAHSSCVWQLKAQ